MKIHLLTNENPLLQEKMRFFADYFSFANEFLGKIPELPFENGYSVVSKILFQLKNNRKHCIAYIENYLAQLFQFYQNNSATKTTVFDTIEKHVEDMKNYSSQSDKTPKFTWINDHPDFLETLELLQKEYELDFEGNLEIAYKLITCKCNLKIHIDELKFCVHSIVSEFRLKGHSKESVAEYIDRLLKKDFPLPPEILSIKDESERASKTEDFLQNQVFKEQLYGLRNILQANIYQSGYFIYLIKDAYIDEELKDKFMVTLDKVTFVAANHKHLAGLKNHFDTRHLEENSDLTSKFFKPNHVFAYLKLNYEKVEITKIIGAELVKQELKQLNLYLHTNLKLNDQDFMFSKDISIGADVIRYGISSHNRSRIQTLFIQAAEENVFEQLRNIQSQAKDKILQSETTFLKAFSSDEVSAYWIYIENLFWNTEYEGIENIRKLISRILLKRLQSEKETLLTRVVFAFKDGYHFGDPKEFMGLTREEIQFIYNEVFTKHNYDIDIHSYKKKISNSFLIDLLSYIGKFKNPSHSHVENWKKFYSSLILELYEYRNIELHSGKILDFSKMKLLTSMTTLVNRIRWILVSSIRANPQLNFNELIKTLI